MYNITKDNSPYFVEFEHTGIEQIVEAVKALGIDMQVQPRVGFIHHPLQRVDAISMINLLPFADKIPINERRVSLFITRPGFYYRAHKDGLDHRVSINYGIDIRDDKCITSWYDDKDLVQYSIDTLGGYSREAVGFDKANHKPIHQMTAQQGKGVLLNTEIYHDFDNSESSEQRVLLTFRIKDAGEWYFEEVKSIIFS